MHRRTLVVLAAFFLFCLTAPNGFTQCAAVTIDMVKGQLTADPDVAPASGACRGGQHATWVTSEHGLLSITFDDANNPAPFTHPTCGGRACNVTVPAVGHADPRRYKYVAEVKYADGHVARTLDPEIVVAGGTFGEHGNHKGKSSDKPPYPPVVKITIIVSGSSFSVRPDPAIVHRDQKVHWHATGGKLDHIHFHDTGVGDTPCNSNECERDVANLTVDKHYAYDPIVVDENGKPIKGDPEIVIAGVRNGRPAKPKS